MYTFFTKVLMIKDDNAIKKIYVHTKKFCIVENLINHNVRFLLVFSRLFVSQLRTDHIYSATFKIHVVLSCNLFIFSFVRFLSKVYFNTEFLNN